MILHHIFSYGIFIDGVNTHDDQLLAGCSHAESRIIKCDHSEEKNQTKEEVCEDGGYFHETAS